MNAWQLSAGSVWFIPTETTISTDPDTPIYNQMTAIYAMTGSVEIVSHLELRGSLA